MKPIPHIWTPAHDPKLPPAPPRLGSAAWWRSILPKEPEWWRRVFAETFG